MIVTKRVVIDTNILLATINRRNFEFFIYKAFADKKFHWVVSTEILMEYAEKLTEMYSVETADYIINALCSANNVIFAEPYYRWSLVQKDPDDNKFSDLAISVNATCLITHDKHFNVFKKLKFPTLKVLNPEEFKQFLEEWQG